MLTVSLRIFLTGLVAASLSFLPSRAISLSNAEAAYNQLQTWYNQSNGLWIPSTGWWNSANCLTVIADLAAIDNTVKAEAQSVFQTTWVKAQQYNLAMQKVQGTNSLPWTYYAHHWPTFPPGMEPPPPARTDGFLNSYYDDEGWWALAWIAVYDVTGNQQYLQTAESIFSDIYAAYNTTTCGGVWWDKAHTYVNAIANELFLSVGAHLANRVPSGQKSHYLQIALDEWNWFKSSGMINAQNTINDGLNDTTCRNNGGTVWSYNQGVILGALVELSKATGDGSYIAEAKTIASAAIANLTINGILHDSCESDCGADGSQFKGVFARNLQVLQQASPEQQFEGFLQTNADSIWKDDNQGAKLSLIWSGPFVSPANASTQSSAMDALVAALATQ